MSVETLAGSAELARLHAKTFFSFENAQQIVADATSKIVVHQYPKNIPDNWKITIIGHFGLKFVNPDDQDEWIKVLPPTSGGSFAQDAKVVYHKPAKWVLKGKSEKVILKKFGENRFMENAKEFNSEDPELKKILDDLVKITHQLRPQERATEVAKRLGDYWISLKDLKSLRKQFGFQDFPDSSEFQKVLEKLREELLCDCFGTYISDTQFGAISEHNLNHYDSVRLAFHFKSDDPEDDRAPSIKISFAGQYRDVGGNVVLEEDTSSHVDFAAFLRGDFAWFEPFCKNRYKFSKFDYRKHPITPLISKLTKKNRLIKYNNTKRF